MWKYGSLLFLRKFYASGPCMVFCCRTISAKLYILYYINYTTCTLKMYFRISETYLLFIGCVTIMIIEMRVQLKNLKHDQITLLHSNPLSFLCVHVHFLSLSTSLPSCHISIKTWIPINLATKYMFIYLHVHIKPGNLTKVKTWFITGIY